MLFKSQTQKILLYAIDSSTGLGKSGLTDLVCSVSKDGASNASATNTAAAVGNGLYSLELTAAETGAALVGVSATSATASVVVNPLIVFTTDGAVPPQEAGTSGGLGTVDASNRIAGIQGTINDLDGLPTAATIADQVWDEATSGHTSAGSYGKAVGDGVTTWVTATGFNTTTPPTVEAIADQVWDEATSGHTSAGSYGKAIGDGVTSWVTATGFSTFDSSADAVTVGNVSSTPINAIADGLLDRADGVEPASAGTERTVREALRLILSACAGQVAGASGTTITIRDTNDTTNRITATVDSDGNRTAVTYIDS